MTDKNNTPNPAASINVTVTTVLQASAEDMKEANKALRGPVSSMAFAMNARDGSVTEEGLSSAIEGKSPEEITEDALAIRLAITEGKIEANNTKLREQAAVDKAAKAEEAPAEVEG
jgi:hypothetical protein